MSENANFSSRSYFTDNLNITQKWETFSAGIPIYQWLFFINNFCKSMNKISAFTSLLQYYKQMLANIFDLFSKKRPTTREVITFHWIWGYRFKLNLLCLSLDQNETDSLSCHHGCGLPQWLLISCLWRTTLWPQLRDWLGNERLRPQIQIMLHAGEHRKVLLQSSKTNESPKWWHQW